MSTNFSLSMNLFLIIITLPYVTIRIDNNKYIFSGDNKAKENSTKINLHSNFIQSTVSFE